MPPGIGYPDPNDPFGLRQKVQMGLFGGSPLGLLAGGEQMPGLLGARPPMQRPLPPGTQGTMQAPPPQQKQGGGVGSALAQLFGGQDDPSLSAEENQKASRQARLQAGLQILAASQGGMGPRPSALGAIAQGAMAGQQAGGEQRAVAYARTQEERVRQALEDPAVTGKLSPDQLAMIRLMPPMEAAKLLSQLAFAPKPEPKVVSEGGALVDPTTGQPIYQNPQSEPLPSELRGLARTMGVDVDNLSPEQGQLLRTEWEKLKRSGATSVNVGRERQTEEGITKLDLGDVERVRNEAVAAEGLLPQLSLLDSLLAGGLQTGPTAASTLRLRRLAADIGVASPERLEKLEGQELFQNVTNKLVLEQVGQMKGNLSEKEMDFLANTVPSLALSPGGNKKVIEAMRRAAQRKVQIADMMTDYYRRNGSLQGWDQFRREWVKSNPLFDDLMDPFEDG